MMGVNYVWMWNSVVKCFLHYVPVTECHFGQNGSRYMCVCWAFGFALLLLGGFRRGEVIEWKWQEP